MNRDSPTPMLRSVPGGARAFEDAAEKTRAGQRGYGWSGTKPKERDREGNDRKGGGRNETRQGRLPFWLLAGFLVIAFLIGGSARGDIASLVLLRPVAVLVLGFGLMSLGRRHVAAYPLHFAVAAASLALVLLQLAPLPPEIVHTLPGHDIIADIDRLAGLQGLWRPMTMTPAATRNALLALMPPFAVLVLAIQLSVRQRADMLKIMLALGLASAFLGLLQILGDPQGVLYFYRITNNGAAVGLFANRNHQAVLLAGMIPMLAVWVRLQSERRGATRSWRRISLTSAVLAGLFLIPLILVTGSRSGIFTALLALVSLLFLRGPVQASGLVSCVKAGGAKTRVTTGFGAKAPGLARAMPWLLVMGVAVLVGIAIWLDRALAVNRLIAGSPADDMRIRIMPTVKGMIADFFPWGSGFGSFPQVYQLHEPDGLLSPTYMNHAHNDWLELALTGGVPALLILACVVGGWFARAISLATSRKDPAGAPPAWHGMARLGLVVMLLFGLASFSDYPLRVPSLACLFVLAAVWAAAPGEEDEGTEGGAAAVTAGTVKFRNGQRP